MLIVLLRHGQTAYNEQRRYQGSGRALRRGKSRLKGDFETETV
ncbi:MAG: histidine phosphatase family protein [Christensenellales bacterium]